MEILLYWQPVYSKAMDETLVSFSAQSTLQVDFNVMGDNSIKLMNIYYTEDTDRKIHLFRMYTHSQVAAILQIKYQIITCYKVAL